jgi:hypothetical protein
MDQLLISFVLDFIELGSGFGSKRRRWRCVENMFDERKNRE